MEMGEFYHLAKMNEYKTRLYAEITQHEASLLSFHEAWEAHTHEFQDQTRNRVKTKILEIKARIEKILEINRNLNGRPRN